ncbi:MAG: RNA polymerase sigma factor [Anaerolineales bacterium]|nr:RNA polymerase sigma factor [Anaerolineales bacterium]MDW8446181.1 RNA polymerase sigma factor [Anaerolineales bacterium]
MDEETAIARLKAGDVAGLEFLVLRYQVKALRVANLITRDLPLAEDVVQECFLRLIRSIRSFDGQRPFEPWFLRSVIRAAVRAAKQQARHLYAESESEEAWFESLLGSGKSAEAEVEAMQDQQRVLHALQKLSPRQRAVLVQRYYLGWSEKEMIAELGVRPGTVKWLLNAARTRLRSLLEKGGRDETR